MTIQNMSDVEVVALYAQVAEQYRIDKTVNLTPQHVQQLVRIASRALTLDAQAAESEKVVKLEAEILRLKKLNVEIDDERRTAYKDGYTAAKKRFEKDAK